MIRLLAWLGLPSWVLPLIGVGLVSVALSFAYLKGYSAAAGKCEAASLRVQLAGMQRDIDAMREADRIEAIETAKLDALLADMEAEIAGYEIELEAKPDNKCALTPDDVKRLHSGGQR